MASDPINLGLPSSGQNDQIPIPALPSGYAQKIQNFNLDTGLPTLRKGDAIWAAASVFADHLITTLVTYGSGTSQKLFCSYDAYPVSAAGVSFIDVSTGVWTSVYAPAGAGNDREVQTLAIKNYLLFFGEISLKPGGAGVPQYDGATWSLSGFTYPTMTNPFGGNVFKGRAYILERASTKYAYSGPGFISGATVEVDLASIISSYGYLYGIRSISLSDGIEQENVQAFIFSTGEVLVYSGSYPNSDDWDLVGRFVIPPPIYYNSFVDVSADSYVITKADLISLRELFQAGANGVRKDSVTTPIANRWAQCLGFDWATGLGLNMYVKGVYDYLKQRIIITLPNYIDSSGTRDTTKGLRLIYSFKTQSWQEQVVSLGFSLFLGTAVIFKDNLYQTQWFAVMRPEASTRYLDDRPDNVIPQPYDYEITSAPMVGRGTAFVKECHGLDVIIASDLHAQTNYKLIGDFGRVNSASQKLPSSTLSTTDKPMVNIGISDCTYIQYKISGTTIAGTSVGYQLLGVNAWIEQGGVSR